MTEKIVTADVVTEDAQDEQKIFSPEYVKELREESKKHRQEKASLKKEYDDTVAKLSALESEKLTDSEKKDKKVKELESELLSLKDQIKEKEINNLILQAISGKNIVDLETAMLLIKKELSSEENIDDKVVTKVIDKLLKDKPFLISSTNVNPSDGNFKKQDNELAKNPDKMFSEFLHGK